MDLKTFFDIGLQVLLNLYQTGQALIDRKNVITLHNYKQFV